LKKKGNLGLTVTPTDLQKIMLVIQDVQRSDNDAVKAFVVKKNLLAIVRHLIRHQGVFDIIRKELDFYMKLLSWCRSEPNREFNREAWHLFYKVIQFHPGLFDFIKGNVLTHFLEAIGTASPPIVMQNGLRWLNRVFNLPFEEQKLLQAGKPSRLDKEASKSTKEIEKDIKVLGQFYVQHTLFIKIHMIYRNLAPKCAGPAFMELSRFYYSLSTHKYNEKVLKEIIKKDDYKIGINHLTAMFNIAGDLEPTTGKKDDKKKKEDKPKDVGSPKDKPQDGTLKRTNKFLSIHNDEKF